MDNALPFLFFLAGLIMIIKGSDWFIDAAIWMARVFKVPDFIIGATLVSLCTTLPEAMVSTSSALRGNTDMAVGNALGSIAFNTGFILAITIILTRPELKDRKSFRKKGVFLVGLLLLIAMTAMVFGQVSRAAGIGLLFILVLYLYNNIRESRKGSLVECSDQVECDRNTVTRNLLLFIAGLALTIIGSNLLVTNGEKIAVALGVPDIVIGLTMASIGTSLPELMTALTAIRKKAQNLSLGNVLGANILNIILVIGLSSTILPIPINRSMVYFHIPFILFIVGSTVAFAFINRENFKRRNGFLLLAVYIAYVALTFRP